MNKSDTIKLVLIISTVASGLLVPIGDMPSSGSSEDAAEYDAPERDNVTVITTSPSSDSDAKIVAFDENGSLLYLNTTYDKYFDVDPVKGTTHTVEYIAMDGRGDKPIETVRVERLNLTTGNITKIVSLDRKAGEGDWHDADRIGESKLLMADIGKDRVLIYNTSTEVTTFSYEFSRRFKYTSGGAFQSDFSHLNDVEMLPSGVIMANPRNMDQVVFIDPDKGVLANRTLGEDDNYSVLNEQHNPDYIPAQEGGPALLIADSENNRVIEYSWQNGEWSQSWVWQDTDMRWPRDADRLPNGHTLISDSNGNRVFELDENGSIVWSVTINTPYESERLGTGDESHDGPAAERIGLSSKQAGDRAATKDQSLVPSVTDIINLVRMSIEWIVPAIVLNGLLFASPPWVGIMDLVGFAGVIVGTILLGLFEAYTRYTITIERREH